jgi:hypothetical protein
MEQRDDGVGTADGPVSGALQPCANSDLAAALTIVVNRAVALAEREKRSGLNANSDSGGNANPFQ